MVAFPAVIASSQGRGAASRGWRETAATWSHACPFCALGISPGHGTEDEGDEAQELAHCTIELAVSQLREPAAWCYPAAAAHPQPDPFPSPSLSFGRPTSVHGKAANAARQRPVDAFRPILVHSPSPNRRSLHEWEGSEEAKLGRFGTKGGKRKKKRRMIGHNYRFMSAAHGSDWGRNRKPGRVASERLPTGRRVSS